MKVKEDVSNIRQETVNEVIEVLREYCKNDDELISALARIDGSYVKCTKMLIRLMADNIMQDIENGGLDI